MRLLPFSINQTTMCLISVLSFVCVTLLPLSYSEASEQNSSNLHTTEELQQKLRLSGRYMLKRADSPCYLTFNTARQLSYTYRPFQVENLEQAPTHCLFTINFYNNGYVTLKMGKKYLTWHKETKSLTLEERGHQQGGYSSQVFYIDYMEQGSTLLKKQEDLVTLCSKQRENVWEAVLAKRMQHIRKIMEVWVRQYGSVTRTWSTDLTHIVVQYSEGKQRMDNRQNMLSMHTLVDPHLAYSDSRLQGYLDTCRMLIPPTLPDTIIPQKPPPPLWPKANQKP